MRDQPIEDKRPRIKGFIIYDTPQDENTIQSGFALTLVSWEHSLGHKAVKISKGGVANRSGLRATSIISHVTSRIVFHSCALITSDFYTDLMFIKILMDGVRMPPCGSRK